VRAINLVPFGAGHRGSRLPGAAQAPAYAVLVVLAVAVILTTVYVLANNAVSDRKAKLADLSSELARDRLLAGPLSSYQRFATLAQERTQTVQEIAATRFDWHAALSDLSRVVPANTSLQSLVGTVAPGASVGGPWRHDRQHRGNLRDFAIVWQNVWTPTGKRYDKDASDGLGCSGPLQAERSNGRRNDGDHREQ